MVPNVRSSIVISLSMLRDGRRASASIDSERRKRTTTNHTSTHLLPYSYSLVRDSGILSTFQQPPSLAARDGSSRPLSSFGHAACACDRTGWRRCDCQGPRYRQGLCRSSQGKPRSRTSLVSHLAHKLVVLVPHMHAFVRSLSYLLPPKQNTGHARTPRRVRAHFLRMTQRTSAPRRLSYICHVLSSLTSKPNPNPLLLWRYVVTWKCTKVGKTVPSVKSRKRWISI
jgi:hypothetical protein